MWTLLIVLFFLFKVFFCGRSDYFKALLNDHFGESRRLENDLPLVTLNDVPCDVFTQIMYYIYQDSCQVRASYTLYT